ncbi:MAG: hypothetical protein HY842_12920 [Bacteroidetes bacterium]|nr:hypothetical protein [Bacteroidota bacterium]
MKRFRFTAMLTIATLAFSFTSCIRETSDSVDQDKIFTNYELFYDANADKTYARATFTFSNLLGTKLELSNPSKVTFNGDMLSFQNALAYYEKEYAGFVESGTFVWEDTEGNTFTNEISIHEIAFPAGVDTILRSAAYELTWVGDSLSQSETVILTVNGENELDGQIFSTNNLGSQSIILDKDKLGKVGQGPGMMWLDRNYLPALTQATSAGGIINGRYRPTNQPVYFN